MSDKKIPYETGQAPLQHENHEKPVTRRDFLAQGLVSGGAFVAVPSIFAGLLKPGKVEARVEQLADCGISIGASGKAAFMCFDLAGGANLAGSNAIVGSNLQTDLLPAVAYENMGLPAAINPNVAGMVVDINGAANPAVGQLAFHAESALLRGIQNAATPATLANVNGSVICARSSNDTGNNPHNPVYGINNAGASGSIVNIVGTRASSADNNAGGRSQAPTSMYDATRLPTKVSSTNEARSLADTGALGTLLPTAAERDALVQAVENISDRKIDLVNTDATVGNSVNKVLSCGYQVASNTVGGATSDDLDPSKDANITTIMTAMDANADKSLNNGTRSLGNSEYARTAATMKLTIGGFAGAATVQLGGFDYHNNKRLRGEQRDEKAGECIGMALEFARLSARKTMIYIFSDGSVSGNGTVDPELVAANGQSKYGWRGDSSTRGAAIMLVYDPVAQPVMRRNQVGSFKTTGTVETAANPASSNVDVLAETVVLNYLAINNDVGSVATVLPNNGLGDTASIDALIAFEPV
ncbi:hypothetical protein MNBD_GAMMA22-1035 [hydrothermal vent metagenome]|uniref:General secretion pathway protein GspF n=1 Tax=hydrothermal vent metagenome TaxID=652676 RepID=A0A3B1A9G8_9ZZZZ